MRGDFFGRQRECLAFIRHDWTRLNGLAAARGQALTPPEFAWQERSWLLIEAGDRDGTARAGAGE